MLSFASVVFWHAPGAFASGKNQCAESLLGASAPAPRTLQEDVDKTIRALADLRLRLDLARISGSRALETTALEADFTKKEQELIAYLDATQIMTPDGLRERLKQEITLLQSEVDRTRTAQTEEEAKVREAQQQQIESLLKWTRHDKHPDLERHGPFLDSDKFFTIKDGDLALYDLKKRAFVWSEDVGEKLAWNTKMILSPQKDWLALITKNRIGLVETKTGQLSWGDFKGASRGFRGTYITKSGTHLVLAGEDGEVYIFTLPDMKAIFVDKKGSYPHGKHITESPNGQYIMISKSDGAQLLFDLKNEREIPTPALGQAPVYHVWDGVFSADSKTYTFINHNSKLFDYDIATGQLGASRYKVTADRDYGIHLSHDGKYLVFPIDIGNRMDKTKPFSVVDAATGAVVTTDFTGHDFKRPSNFLFSPNHPIFAFRDTHRELGKDAHRQLLYIFDVKTLTLKAYDHDPSEYFNLMSFNPDGQSILTTSDRRSAPGEIK